MKTPMQEHIEWLKSEHKKYTDQARKESSLQVLGYAFKIDDCIKHAESMLKKEREIICNAFSDARHGAVESRWTAEEYFIEIFDTKEI
jgi:predicted nucleotidyltransferase